MIIIPSFLISILTFPGVIVHEIAHQIFCRLMRVPVYEVKYFQLTNPCGYVSHEPSDKPLKVFLISIGPFLVNTILGAIFTLPATIEFFQFRNSTSLINIFLGWIGISILMHAFPSTGDAKVMINSILKNDEVSVIVKILILPVIGIIYIGSWGSVVWLDLVYAVAIATLFSTIVVNML
ncbi:metalloprotease family protein [Clostridium uliginosum]|uniref:Putative zincin peptidase n=1 Tax=Clostridium uliginosum TaxID=119641 RepID=A0A1I1IVP0_9CLOT|nr:metalloprotease family protein [Clostridium uliginosum]SFC40337.1 Putative zincin peptidase [Clostridium uliginosum]